MSPSDIITWYLVQLKPNSFVKAKQHLHRQGFAVFAPELKVTKKSNDRFLTKHELLFPGYIFVGVPAETAPWRAINSTRGVSRIVSFGPKPNLVPRTLIAKLRERFETESDTAKTEDFLVNDTVHLTSGPFTEFVAKVQENSHTSQQRVWILIDLMGRLTRLCYDKNDLRKVS